MKKMLFLVFIVFMSFAEARTIQVMSYNVENLFDAQHDEGKNDWTFVPKNTSGKKEACQEETNKHRRKECLEFDWTEKRLEMKLSQIKDVVTKERPLPEFLGVVEVENPHVIAMLGKKLGYENFEMTESPDKRGVDVALFYKNDPSIKKISRAEHVVPVDYPTRNILEVEFLIDGKYPLTLFVNHWPSLANPDSWRVKAAEVLVKRTQEILAKNPQMSFLAMGDFNTIDDNNPHPFKTVLFKDNLFVDINQAYLDDKSIDEKQKKTRPEGTYYYPPKDQWNFLDHFFANKNLMEGKELKILVNSYEIYAPAFMTRPMEKNYFVGGSKQVKRIVIPKRFEPEADTLEAMGFSDHFPILVKLEFPDPPKSKGKSKKKK